MRREILRPLVIWPSLATATIITLMWVTSPGNPFANRYSTRTAGNAVGVGVKQWTPESAREALRQLQDSLRDPWEYEDFDAEFAANYYEPTEDLEPRERPESGVEAMTVPPRVAEAFGFDPAPKTVAQSVPHVVELAAPVLDEHRELAGMTNPLARQAISSLKLPTRPIDLPPLDLDAPNFGITGIVGNELSLAPPATIAASTGRPQPTAKPSVTVVEKSTDLNATVIDMNQPSILELFEVAKDGLARSLTQPAGGADANVSKPEPTDAPKESLSGEALVAELFGPEPVAANSVPEPTGTPESVIPESVRQLAKPAIELPSSDPLALSTDESMPEEIAESEPITESDEAASTTNDRFAAVNPGGWPVAQQLEEQLTRLSSLSSNRLSRFVSQSYAGDLAPMEDETATLETIGTWSQRVADAMKRLRSLDRLGAPEAGDILVELTLLAEEGREGAEATESRETQIEWLRAVHSLNRRVAVWHPVWKIVSGNAIDELSIRSATTEELNQALLTLQEEMEATGDAAGWATFLMTDELRSANASNDANERMVVAQRLLSRLQWYNLTDDQREWLDRESVQQISQAVRPWASGAVDYARLVSQIERQESDALDLSSIDIADAVQSLRFSSSKEATKLGETIDAYYRNANVRVAFSQEMLERFLPEPDSKTVPLRTRLFGSDVRGYSDIQTRLGVDLVPADNRWVIQLNTSGNVQTRSVGNQSGVALRTNGESHFDATTPIEISSNSASSDATTVVVNSQSRLRGVNSDYDGWPLIGPLVRSLAVDRFESLKSATNRIANSRVQRQVADEVDNRVDEAVTNAANRFESTILGPLGQLELDPMVVDMATTEERLLARYRLAGDWQLAAFTPRPRAPRTSLMSVQMHQSAINNTLEQLVPRDEPQTIAQILESGTKLFGFNLGETDSDIPADVSIQFAQTRPITMEIQDGQVWLTMRIVRLTDGDRLDLRRFIVRAAYVPQINGIDASLVRDGHLRISGPSLSMRERLPVRAIFNKVLSANRTIPLVLPQLSEHPAAEGLAVSQLELRDGWLALAISPAEEARVALVTPRLAENETEDESDSTLRR